VSDRLNATVQNLAEVVTATAPNDPVVWALCAIIAVLTGALGLFIRSVLRERDWWREAFLEEQRQKRELLVTGRVVQGVMRGVEAALPDERPPNGGDAG
jgi:hypothetical protein